MQYFFKRLSPKERLETHSNYIGDIRGAVSEDGFDGYNEILQLVELTPRRLLPFFHRLNPISLKYNKVRNRFNFYACYYGDKTNPEMELRAWIPGGSGIEARFKDVSMSDIKKETIRITEDEKKYGDVSSYLNRINTRNAAYRSGKSNFSTICSQLQIDIGLLREVPVDKNCLPDLDTKAKELIEKLFKREQPKPPEPPKPEPPKDMPFSPR